MLNLRLINMFFINKHTIQNKLGLFCARTGRSTGGYSDLFTKVKWGSAIFANNHSIPVKLFDNCVVL